MMIDDCSAVKSNMNFSIKDFDIIRLIGSGSYGEVYLIQKKDTKMFYALKVLDKKMTELRNQVKEVINEKDILSKLNFPFIIKMYQTFQDKEKLYILMDYCSGGDLSYHLFKTTKLTEHESKFYAAQLVLAIEYLHNLNILNRDIKAENVLIDSDGYLKLIDFGLSVISDDASNPVNQKMFGTKEYLPPEVISRKKYEKSGDWWEFGNLLYVMLTGHPAFENEDSFELARSIRNKKVEIPSFLSNEAADFLSKLFEKNPNKRLGSGPNGIDDIKNHKFFKDINWTNILNKREIPIFKPELKKETDNDNFPCEDVLLEACKDKNICDYEVEFDDEKDFKDFNYSEDKLIL